MRKSNKKYKRETKELERLNKYRSSIGARTLRGGVKTCLYCNEEFFSQDVTRVRLCEKCREWTRKTEWIWREKPGLR